MDDAKKKAGPPDSLSRKEEKANKRNTNKKRRQEDRKNLREGLPTFKQFLESATLSPRYFSKAADANKHKNCATCGKKSVKADMRMLKGKESCPDCVEDSKA